MEGHDPAAYGESVGPDYDLLYPSPDRDADTAAAVDALAGLAGDDGSVLELGIGTGRLAVPLLERGVRVAGIEGSPAMLDRLRSKPRGAEIEVVRGDLASARVPGSFSVVALTFNTVFALPTRDAQIECFRNAARHLAPGGCFVIEAFVLRPEQLRGEWSIRPRTVEHDRVELQVACYDPARHVIDRTLLHLRSDGLRVFGVVDLYAWPGELDLMARIAGLRLRSRAGGWSAERFDAASDRHVSVYEAAAG